MFKLCIWMNAPSSYQSDFFEALSLHDDVDLQVRYFERVPLERVTEGWCNHHVCQPYEQYVEGLTRPAELLATLDDGEERIHITSSSFNLELVEYLCSHHLKWCHWSEMPGFRLDSLLGNFTGLYRLLNPIMLALKHKEGRRIAGCALGVFGQGFLAGRAFRHMGVDQKRIVDLYYGPSALPELDPCEQVTAFAKGRKIFLSVGALCRRKGIDVVLKAFAKLDAEGWCLVLCGRDMANGTYQALAKKLCIEDRVLFLGAYSSDRIAEVYVPADVFVLASRFDGWGVVLNEAASLGLPLIGTDNCGAAWHQIKSGGNGYRVKAGSVRRLLNAMRVYVEKPALIGTHGVFSKALYFREFTPERNSQRLVDALEVWNDSSKTTRPPVRIIIQQPALPKYRVPFFREIMNRPGIGVKLLYASVGDSLNNDPSVDLDAEFVPMMARKVGSTTLMWHIAQLSGAKHGACDVLVLSWNVQYLSLIPALMRARSNGIRTILWGHGYSKKESGFRKKIRDMVGRMADALLFYDHSTAAKFIQAGWDERKIHVAPNSLDQTVQQQIRMSWIDSPSRLQTFQKQHNLYERKNIIFIGRIYEDNRLDLLIRALPSIRREHPDVQVLVIGRVNTVALDLQRLAEGLGVAGSIRWLGAIYDENEIAPYMLSSQLFCYPSNIGLSIVHAMGYGVPVITGDDIPSHNPEIHVLEEGRNGWVFRHLDVDDLADKISTVLSDPGKAKLVGCAARDTILQSFTIEKMVDGFVEAVEAVKELGIDPVG